MNELKNSEPRVMIELEHLHKSLEVLSEAIERHATRIQSVLGPATSGLSEAGEKKEDSCCSDLSKIIMSAREKVNFATERLSRLDNQLEI